MAQAMDQSWKDWITLNLSRGCDNIEIIQILLDHKFDPSDIIYELRNYPDSLALTSIVNQLALSKSQELTKAKQMLTQNEANFLAIDSIILPLADRVKTDKAHIYTLENFLSADECRLLIELIRSRCQPSTITNPDETDKVYRTSQTCDLGILPNQPLVQEIERRISEYMGIEVARAEPMQGQYYQVGQQFKVHTDYFEPNTAEYEKFAGNLGQRTWTFMIYLNEVVDGGETAFPDLNTVITPSPGKAVIWNSICPSGAVNPATSHWAKPIIEGEKFVITKWFRTYGSLKHSYKIPARKTMPVLTEEGFKKLRVPSDLQHELEHFYLSQKHLQTEEKSDAIGTYIESVVKTHPTHMIELNETLRTRILGVLKPYLEEWVKHPLDVSTVYGIREYKRGSTLGMHADRIETHHVSAILNVAQQVDSEWALHIHDHKGRLHRVFMKPGEMLFYESARLDHGRPTPLDGEYYANIFTHTSLRALLT